MRAWAAWRERFTRGNTLHSWFLPLVLPSLLPPSSTLNLTHPNQHLGSIPCSCRRFICSPFLVCQVQPLILRDLCKKASCDPLRHSAGHCVGACGCGIVGRSVVLWVHISSGHTSTNQRFGHLPQNTIALPGYLGLVKIFSKCCFPSFWGNFDNRRLQPGR